MSLQARRIGETQAQYRRRVGTKRPQTVNPGLNRQKVERVSVMPQDMKATDRGRPVTRIGNKTIYEADVREAKANQQNLLQAQLRNNLTTEKFNQLAGQRQKLPPELVEQLKKQQQEAFRKIRQQATPQQQLPFAILPNEKTINPRTGKPFTPQQLKQIRANNERFEKEQAKKRPLFKKFMEGSIGVRELRGTFTPREIRNIEKGRIVQQFIGGKITDRQLSRSGKFSLKEIRDIKKSLQFKRMSPEERRAFIEREQQRQLRRQRRPDRRRRQVRRAYRRVRGGDRDNVITYQTTGRRRRVSPTQTQRRRRVAPTQRRRRGMRVPI